MSGIPDTKTTQMIAKTLLVEIAQGKSVDAEFAAVPEVAAYLATPAGPERGVMLYDGSVIPAAAAFLVTRWSA